MIEKIEELGNESQAVEAMREFIEESLERKLPDSDGIIQRSEIADFMNSLGEEEIPIDTCEKFWDYANAANIAYEGVNAEDLIIS